LLSIDNLPGRKRNFVQEVKGSGRPEASYMAEAIVILPVFVTFMTILLFFFRVLQVQQLVDNALIQTGRELSVASYGASVKKISENSFSAGIILQKNLKASRVAGQFINGGNLGISLLRSEFKGDFITLRADYQIKIPLLLLGKYNFKVTQQVKCRKWTGRNLSSGESGKEEEIVYITSTGRAYHKNRNCTYLKPKVKSIAEGKIDSSRNADGAKYYPCSKCGRDLKGKSVYVTDYGNRFHSNRNCSKILRMVCAVFLSEVGDRYSCSKCSR